MSSVWAFFLTLSPDIQNGSLSQDQQLLFSKPLYYKLGAPPQLFFCEAYRILLNKNLLKLKV